MKFAGLNPFVRYAGAYEVINRSEECVAYDCRLIYLISGEMSVFLGEKKYKMCDGCMLYIPSGTAYKLKGQYFRAAIISFDLTSEYADITEPILPSPTSEFDRNRLHAASIVPFDSVLYTNETEGERDAIEHIISIATGSEGAWRDILSAEVKLILIKLYSAVSDDALPVRMSDSLDTYIRENCREEISNTEVGAIFGYHPFYVSRLLKEKKGITLRQYIISYRLKASKKLLRETRMSIAEIADEVGFTDASYFTKTFRQNEGMTPKEYRNLFKDDFI